MAAVGVGLGFFGQYLFTRQLQVFDLSLILVAFVLLAGVVYSKWERLVIGKLTTSLVGDSSTPNAPTAIQQQLLRQAIHTLPLGLMVIDEDGKIELSNPHLGRLLSLRHDPTDERLADLPTADELLPQINEAQKSGSVVHGQLVRPESRYQLANQRQLTSSTVPLADGRTLLLLQDLTDSLHQLESHRELVANVSHELKTPLTAIRGYAETLNDGALQRPEVAQLFTQRILEQCERLESVLQDLLVVARLEGEGGVIEEPQEVDLVACLHRTLEVVATQASAKEIHWVLDTPEGLPSILGHVDELEHMLLNLLDNSIKYNRRGGQVAITVAMEGSDLCLDIRDQGIGIPPRDLQRIFERFYRVDKGRSRQQGGTGLGLAIVYQVVELHHGSIDVESQLGSGSCFRVRLPSAGPPHPAQTDVAEPEPDDPTQPFT